MILIKDINLIDKIIDQKKIFLGNLFISILLKLFAM